MSHTTVDFLSNSCDEIFVGGYTSFGLPFLGCSSWGTNSTQPNTRCSSIWQYRKLVINFKIELALVFQEARNETRIYYESVYLKLIYNYCALVISFLLFILFLGQSLKHDFLHTNLMSKNEITGQIQNKTPTYAKNKHQSIWSFLNRVHSIFWRKM